MGQVFKAELLRIYKLKSLRILTILSFVAILLSMVFIKLDQAGSFNFNIVDVVATKPLREGESTLSVKANKDGRYTLATVAQDDMQFQVLGEYDLTSTEQEISLNRTMHTGSMVVLIQQLGNGVNSSLPVSVTISKEDNGSGHKAMFNKYQYGMSNVVNGITNTWYTWIALVIGVIVFAGDFTHKRFKNYLHFVKNRESVLIGKFLASFTATFILQVSFVVFGLIVSGLLFGLGLGFDGRAIFVNLLYFVLTVIFILSFLMLLSVITRSTATTVGLYLAKTIVLSLALALLMNLVSQFQSVGFWGFLKDMLTHIYENATASAMMMKFTRFVTTGDAALIFVPMLYWAAYVVISWLFSIIVFKKTDI